MAFAPPNAAGKRTPPPQAGSATQPDPLVQPALANAMRLGKTFGRLSSPMQRQRAQERGQTVAGMGGSGAFMPATQKFGKY